MHTYYKHRIVFLLILYISGVLTGSLFNFEQQTIFIILTTAFLIFLKYKNNLIFLLIFFILGFYLANNQTKTEHINPDYLNKEISVKGTLTKNPEKRKKSHRLTVKTDSIIHSDKETDFNSKAVFYITDEIHNLYSGDLILIRNVKLNDIKEFKNPGSFNLKDHFYKKAILYSAFISNSYQIEKVSEEPIYNPFYKIQKFRKNYEKFVRENIPPPENEILIALTIGEKGGIPNEIRNSFSYLGIAHLLAISGLHLGFITIIIYFSIKCLLKRSTYILLMYEVPRLASILTILPLFLYTAIAGFATPVVRAFIMISLYLLAIFLNKQNSKLNILASAALIILIFDPKAIKTLSFQLSFLAVSGILLFNYIFPLKFSSNSEKILSALKTTIAATLFTLPLTINSFGYFPIASIPANFVIVPIVEFLIVPLGLFSVISYTFSSSAADLILKINEKLVSFLLYSANKISSIELTQITVGSIDIYGYLLLALTLIFILMVPKLNKSKYVAAFCFILFSIYIVNYKPLIKDKLEINYLDSGHKSYTLINIPNGKKILISGGYSYRNESNFIETAAIIPFLLNKGITKIDYLWLFSLDKSQLIGADSILKRIEVDSIWTNGAKLNSSIWEKIYKKNIKWKNLQDRLDNFSIDNTDFRFIKPSNYNDLWSSKKPKHILLIVKNFENKFIFTEEINYNSIQKELTTNYKDVIKSDIIFMNKQNKNNTYLTEFIDYSNTQYLISNEPFSISKNKPMTLNTKSDGMITIYSSENNIELSTFIN